MSDILPVKRSKNSAQRFYDRISGIYDWLTASEKKLIGNGISILSPSPGETILEIGSGTGTGMEYISEGLAGAGSLTGLDLSRRMLMTSQEKLKHIHPPSLLIQGDGARLPLQAMTFNGVFCSFTLELFSSMEIRTVLQEIRRVLKPDGRMVIISLSQTPKTIPQRFYKIAHRVFPTFFDCRPIPLIDLVKEAGFQVQYQEKLMTWGLPIQIVMAIPSSEQAAE
jgi:demethylmenaquinone methyltransferase/2-methoxy-6-polyprenyl-1,4-benzoquinol methylase